MFTTVTIRVNASDKARTIKELRQMLIWVQNNINDGYLKTRTDTFPLAPEGCVSLDVEVEP